MAEATAAGRITELIVNIGVPGGFAAKAASSIARAGIVASQSGRLVNLGTKAGKEVVEAIGKKAATKVAPQLTKTGKALTFGSGALGAGVAEGIFVADTEDAGTFGDLLGGPTEIDRSSGTAEAELLNRLKFGTESLFITPFVFGAGKAGKALATRGQELAYSNSVIDRWINKYIRSPFQPQGDLGPELFASETAKAGLKARDTFRAEELVNNITKEVPLGLRRIKYDSKIKKIKLDKIITRKELRRKEVEKEQRSKNYHNKVMNFIIKMSFIK